MMYLHSAVVSGVSPFPIDMLRYDECWPSRQDDVDRLHDSIAGHANSYVVQVDTYAHEKDPTKAFNPERWASFGATWQHVESAALMLMRERARK